MNKKLINLSRGYLFTSACMIEMKLFYFNTGIIAIKYELMKILFGNIAIHYIKSSQNIFNYFFNYIYIK
jgi:hypothetical protein